MNRAIQEAKTELRTEFVAMVNQKMISLEACVEVLCSPVLHSISKTVLFPQVSKLSDIYDMIPVRIQTPKPPLSITVDNFHGK